MFAAVTSVRRRPRAQVSATSCSSTFVSGTMTKLSCRKSSPKGASGKAPFRSGRRIASCALSRWTRDRNSSTSSASDGCSSILTFRDEWRHAMLDRRKRRLHYRRRMGWSTARRPVPRMFDGSIHRLPFRSTSKTNVSYGSQTTLESRRGALEVVRGIYL